MSTAEEKAILITGTSRGIGEALARHFLDAGRRVIGLSRGAGPIVHRNFHHIAADLSDAKNAAGIRGALAGFRVEGLINNAAAFGPIGPFEKNDLDGWIRAFHVNLFGAAALTQLLIPGLRREKGFVIFFSGGGAAFPRPNFSAYSVSKTAVVRFAENLAEELKPDVLVYTIAPGPNRTKLMEEGADSGFEPPCSSFVGFEEPVGLCDFLANNRDPRYSGKFIHVKNSYRSFTDEQLAGDGYTLRHVKR